LERIKFLEDRIEDYKTQI